MWGGFYYCVKVCIPHTWETYRWRVIFYALLLCTLSCGVWFIPWILGFVYHKTIPQKEHNEQVECQVKGLSAQVPSFEIVRFVPRFEVTFPTKIRSPVRVLETFIEMVFERTCTIVFFWGGNIPHLHPLARGLPAILALQVFGGKYSP